MRHLIVLFVSFTAFTACTESPATVDDREPIPGGKTDGPVPIPFGSYRDSAAADGDIALLLLESDHDYRRIIVGAPVEESGTFTLTTNEWEEPRIVFGDELGNLRDEADYVVDGRMLRLVDELGAQTLTREDDASCSAAGGACRWSPTMPGVPPRCEDFDETSALGWCRDFSEACCVPAEPVDCRTTGCDAGSTCEDCIDGYACMPNGVSC